MRVNVFERLAGAMDRLSNGFPRTASGVKIVLSPQDFSAWERTRLDGRGLAS